MHGRYLHFVEDLVTLLYTESTLTVENVVFVMTHWELQNWKVAFVVKDWEIVPQSQLDVIENKCSTIDECYHECATFYLKYNHKASWRDLAERMYKSGAESASLEAVKPYLPPKGMIENLCRCIICTTDFRDSQLFVFM